MIETKKDTPNRRAKHSRISLNSKRVDFPLKATNIGQSELQEIDIARRETGRPIFNQIGVQITPRRLRELVTNLKAHQDTKDSIRRVLARTTGKELNVIVPLLMNQRSSHEPEDEFRPFPQPTQKMVERIFDLCDIDGIDMLVTPVAQNDAQEAWARIAADVYANRKPDFLNECIRSGMIPNSVSEGTAKKMAALYIANGFDSLTFDFAAQKVREVRMREIIHSVPIWGDLFIHGINVPHHDWHGTYNRNVMPTYDLLVSVYGFDSFGGVMWGYKDDIEKPEKIANKMGRKRYCVTDTYGAYTKSGLAQLLDAMSYKCRCPVCSKVSSPLELYSGAATRSDLDLLGARLKTHRLHVTHKEVKGVSGLIDASKYYDYLYNKKAAANELRGIISALE
jgi:hypothetical protein